MKSAPMDGGQSPASLAPIHAALAILVGLGLLLLALAALHSLDADAPASRAPAAQPARDDTRHPPFPPAPKRAGKWARSGPAQGSVSGA